MIKPLTNKMVVELPQDVNDVSKSSIIMLLKRTDRIVSSEVVAVGDGKTEANGKHVAMEYSVGDIVYYPADCEQTAPRIKHDGKEYLVLIQEQVLCYKPISYSE